MQKEKFATQSDPQLLSAVRALAEQEGRQFQSLIEEAMRDLLEKRRGSKPREHVARAFETSITAFDGLYKKLAK